MLKEDPQYIFHHDKRPEVAHDLADVDENSTELLITGKTKILKG